jgi:hypothetical protein
LIAVNLLVSWDIDCSNSILCLRTNWNDDITGCVSCANDDIMDDKSSRALGKLSEK